MTFWQPKQLELVIVNQIKCLSETQIWDASNCHGRWLAKFCGFSVRGFYGIVPRPGCVSAAAWEIPGCCNEVQTL